MPRTVPVNQHHLECRVQKLFPFLHERAQQDYVNCVSYIAGELEGEECLRKEPNGRGSVSFYVICTIFL